MQNTKDLDNIKILSVNTSGDNTHIGWGTYNTISSQWIMQISHFILASPQLRNDFFSQEIENMRNTVKELYSNLNALCCVIGPGSFTGLRLGLSFLKGISGVYNIPIVGIKTHELWAYSYRGEKHPLLIIHDSRRERAYVATYNNTKDTISDSFMTDFQPQHLSEITEMTFEEIVAKLHIYKQTYKSPLLCVGTAIYNMYVYIKKNHKKLLGEYIVFTSSPIPQVGLELLHLGTLCFEQNNHILDEYADPFYIKAEV